MTAASLSHVEQLPYPFVRRLGEELRRLTQPSVPVNICVGYSTGADSTALLAGLVALSHAGPAGAIRLHAAHLDHGLRAESAEDARWAARQAEAWAVPITVERCDIAAIATDAGASIETTARQVRLAFLDSVAQQSQCDFVAVAHHANDQAETVLHRLLRGSGLQGLTGMPARRWIRPGGRVRLIRPLLNIAGADLRAALRTAEIPWREDDSNQSDAYTRNRIRRQVLPLLARAVNPAAAAALVRLSVTARRAQKLLRPMVRRALRRCRVLLGPDAIELDAAALSALPEYLRVEVLRRAALGVGASADRFGHAAVERLLTVLADTRATDFRGDWPGPLRVELADGRLRLCVGQSRTRARNLQPPEMP